MQLKADRLVSGILSNRLVLKFTRTANFPLFVPKRLLPILLDPTLDVSIDRVKFKIFDPTYCHHKWVYSEGGYEYPVTKHILANISKGDVFVDVGAFYGYYTLFVAKALAGSGKVYSFEPNREYYDIVDRNLKLNNVNHGVDLHNIALSDRRETVTMESSWLDQSAMYKWRGPLKRKMRVVDGESIVGESKVDTISFDEFSDKNDVSPNFVKIDVDGAEGKVLEGMKRTLKKVTHLYCEVHAPQVGIIGGHTVESVAKILLDSGMKAYEFKNYRRKDGEIGERGELEELYNRKISASIMIYATR